MVSAHVICRSAICTFKLPLLLNVDEQLKKWKRLLMPFCVRNERQKLGCALSQSENPERSGCTFRSVRERSKAREEKANGLKINYRQCEMNFHIFFICYNHQRKLLFDLFSRPGTRMRKKFFISFNLNLFDFHSRRARKR